MLYINNNRFFPVGKELTKKERENLERSGGLLDDVGKGLFTKNIPYIGENRSVPYDLIWDRMRMFATPIYSEYVEDSENPEFLEISPLFFEYLYGNECLYVAYDIDQNLLIDPESVEYDPIKDPGLMSLGYAWTDIESRKPGEPFKFCNLITGVVIAVLDWREHFIKVTWNGYNENRFMRFYRFSLREILNSTKLEEATYACTKRIQTNAHNENQDEIDALNSSLRDLSPILPIREGIAVDPTVFMPAAELKDFMLVLNQGNDRELYELGRVANTNPKGDRLSTGENYKDIVAIANRQRAVLSRLTLFSKRAMEMGGITLDFKISTVPERAETSAEEGEGGSTNDSRMF